MTASGRDADTEYAPFAMNALGCDRAAMQLHKLLDQSQADPRAFMSPPLRAGHAMEALEQLGQLVGRDAGASVADDELERSAGVAQPDFDLALERELEGIGNEIEDNLFPHLAIDIGRLGERRTVDVEPQPCLLDGRTK